MNRTRDETDFHVRVGCVVLCCVVLCCVSPEGYVKMLREFGNLKEDIQEADNTAVLD
jgi:hypothetical protein